MKSLARSYIWWPKIDQDIELMARSCSGCQQTLKVPNLAPLHPWETPIAPWTRIHIDYAGPFLNHMFLVVQDSTTKWPEIILTSSGHTTTEWTISALRTIFARLGIPKQLVSDNGPQFRSEAFKNFTQKNGIKHIFSAAYHASTNGLAERLVQSFKNSLKAAKNESGNIQHKLDNFLASYRNSPHMTTGETPAVLLYGRRLRTRLDLLRPGSIVQDKQEAQVARRGKGRLKHFNVGQKVLVRNYSRSNPDKWIPGIICSKSGPVSYLVDIGNNIIWRRHLDQIQGLYDNVELSGSVSEENPDIVCDNSNKFQELLSDLDLSQSQNVETNVTSGNDSSVNSQESESVPTVIPVTNQPNLSSPETGLRRSERVRRAPDKLDL